MNEDFNYFVDSILVEAADRQIGKVVKPISMKELVAAVNPAAPPTWTSMAEDRMRELKYAEFYRDSEDPILFYLEINAAGLARSAETRIGRAPKHFLDRLASDRNQRLLNFGAFGVSLISLAVAILALVKSGS